MLKFNNVENEKLKPTDVMKLAWKSVETKVGCCVTYEDNRTGGREEKEVPGEIPATFETLSANFPPTPAIFPPSVSLFCALDAPL